MISYCCARAIIYRDNYMHAGEATSKSYYIHMLDKVPLFRKPLIMVNHECLCVRLLEFKLPSLNLGESNQTCIILFSTTISTDSWLVSNL